LARCSAPSPGNIRCQNGNGASTTGSAATTEEAAVGVELTKDSVDLGIVVRDAEAALHFYRDVLGLEDQGEMPMPGGNWVELLQVG
jgi:hypothetical protein